MADEKVGVVIYGCGVMGRRIAQALLAKKSFQVVGAVDVNPEIVGRDLGELLEPARPIGVRIERDAAALFGRVRARAVLHATSSRLEAVAPQLAQCAEAGLDVVSTCEELSFPWKRHPERARELDALARRRDVTIVGTGINPGYLMDTLPVFLTAPCLRVDSIRVTRMMNSARRRVPFQEKVGTALTPDEFRRKIASGAITGHVGLVESIELIGASLDWTFDEVRELPPEPVLAERETPSALGPVPPGRVIGLRSTAYGTRGGDRAVELEFCAHAAVAEEYDEVVIRGEPGLRQKILGGVHGDAGTVAMVVHTVPRAIAAPAGLRTMTELEVPRWVP